MIKKILFPLTSLHKILQNYRVSIHNYKILSVEYGQHKTIERWQCIDRDNNPIPWYTYPAIEYIKQLDFSEKIVFEYGSGNSTKFWAKRCQKLISIENDLEWYQTISSQLPDNVDYHFLPKQEEYVQSILNYAHDFDIIIIDGRYRDECVVAALQKLKEDGLIILDNSDREKTSSELLRNADLIEVDMSGFGPINAYTWTTSFYFTRKVQLKPAQARQPLPGIGAISSD